MFGASCESQIHNGVVKVPARAVCDGLAGKTDGGFSNIIPSAVLLGIAASELPRTQGAAISVAATVVYSRNPCL